MRTLKSLLAPTMLALSLYPAPGQSTFQNLDFESATLIPIPGDPYGSVQFVAAFPGWTGYIGTNQVSAALYNRAFLDSSGIAIIDSGWQHDLGAAAGVIEGSYSAILQAGVVGTITNPQDTRLSQTGLVPAGAQSLRFKAYDPTLLPSPLGVTLGGHALSLTQLSSGTNYIEFGADIRSWQGQTAELDFILFTTRPHTADRYLFLDSIEFSDLPIPEPSVLSLAALGAMLLGWPFLRKR